MLTIGYSQTYVNCLNLGIDQRVAGLISPGYRDIAPMHAAALSGSVLVLSLPLEVLRKPGLGPLPGVLGGLGMIRSALVAEESVVGIGIDFDFKRFPQRAE